MLADLDSESTGSTAVQGEQFGTQGNRVQGPLREAAGNGLRDKERQ
jgi:hypothetical protein